MKKAFLILGLIFAIGVLYISCKSNHTEYVYSGHIVLCSTDQNGPKTNVGFLIDGELAFIPYLGSSASSIVFVMKEDEAGEFKLEGSTPTETGFKDKEDTQWYCTTDVDWPSSWPYPEFQAHSEDVDHVQLDQDSIDDLFYSYVDDGGDVNDTMQIDLHYLVDGASIEFEGDSVSLNVSHSAAEIAALLEAHEGSQVNGQIMDISIQNSEPEFSLEVAWLYVNKVTWDDIDCDAEVTYETGSWCGTGLTDVRMYPTGTTGYIYLCDNGSRNLTVDDAEKVCKDG